MNKQYVSLLKVSQDSELAEEPLWEDSDTQAFYENLPDLKAIMPAILKDSVKEDKVGPHSKIIR